MYFQFTSLRRCFFLLVMSVTFFFAPLIEAAETRLPVPPEAEYTSIIKRVRGVLRADYGDKSPEARKALAERLLKMAKDSSGNATERYALLAEAWEVSAQGGDIETAQAAATAIITSFAVKAAELRLKTLLSTAKATKRMDTRTAATYTESFLTLTIKALHRANATEAEQAARAAQSYGRKAKDKNLQKTVRALQKNITGLKRGILAWEQGNAKLTANPDDPAANLQAGRFICFWRGEWADGLPLLAKGGADPLAALARTDLGSPMLAAACLRVADAWWQIVEKEKFLPKVRVAVRAGEWYKKALPGLNGLDKVLAESRLQETKKILRAASFTVTATTFSWPTDRKDLIFLWSPGAKEGAVRDPQTGKKSKVTIRARGEAKLEKHSAMTLAKGAYVIGGISESLRKACQESNELSLEIIMQTDNLTQKGPARIVSFSRDGSVRNFTLGQSLGNLRMRLRTTKNSRNGTKPSTLLCTIKVKQRVHILVTYKDGILVCYRNGKEVLTSKKVSGDFSNWEDMTFILGDEAADERDWSGTIYGVAIYSRSIEKKEVRANYKKAAKLFRLKK